MKYDKESNLKYDKLVFIISIIAIYLTNLIKSLMIVNNNLISSIFGSIGITFVDIILWGVIVGFIILPLINALINILKPDNQLSFNHYNKISTGLIIGILVKIIFNIKF